MDENFEMDKFELINLLYYQPGRSRPMVMSAIIDQHYFVGMVVVWVCVSSFQSVKSLGLRLCDLSSLEFPSSTCGMGGVCDVDGGLCAVPAVWSYGDCRIFGNHWHGSKGEGRGRGRGQEGERGQGEKREGKNKH